MLTQVIDALIMEMESATYDEIQAALDEAELRVCVLKQLRYHRGVKYHTVYSAMNRTDRFVRNEDGVYSLR